jgi:DNA modification methylase
MSNTAPQGGCQANGLSITYLPITMLKPQPNNPRTHSDKQVRQIANSIERFGFTNPVLIDADNTIIAGHGRVEAARLLAQDKVPTIRLEDLSTAEIKAYVIADNKLAELAGWDREVLALELQGLLDLDLDFDVSITGFETPEIDILIEELGEKADPADEVPPPDEGATVTRPGDVWLVGPHRLMCGDATQPDAYARLLQGDKAQLVFTDPPYNVPIDGHVGGLGKVKHREFAMASGEMNEAEFTAFLEAVFANLASASADGALNYICMDWRHLSEILTAGRRAYTELKNLCVWCKTNGGMGSMYRSQHELVFVFKAGKGMHTNNVELGRHGRYRTNVWTYAGANTFGKNRDAELALHPTVKPVALVADAIKDASKRGDIVLDAFTGSGTTLVAAAKTGRRGFGLELDPVYCDVTLKRLAAIANAEPVHAGTGKSYALVSGERSPANDPKTITNLDEQGHG